MALLKDFEEPCWMLYYSSKTGKYNPVLVTWANVHDFFDNLFLTTKRFETEEEAEVWAKEFWATYWRLTV